jgi:hypothetical protein
MDNESDTVTPDDIATLNGMAVERSAVFARTAGAVLVLVGVIGAAAWLWYSVRTQLRLDDDQFSATPFGGPGVSLADRIDVLSGYVDPVVWSALAAGVGLGLRVLADYAVARTGGSLTGFQIGDDLASDDDDLTLTRTTDDK